MPSKRNRLGDVEFAAASNAILPFIICPDVSGSMSGQAQDGEGGTIAKIEGLRHGVAQGLSYLGSIPNLRNSVRIGFCTFGDQVTWTPFAAFDDVVAPHFQADGHTPMREALHTVIDEYLDFATEQNAQGRKVQTATILTISDGEPSSDPSAPLSRLLEWHQRRKVYLVGGGVDESDRQRLQNLGFPETASIAAISWPGLFKACTASIASIAAGQRPVSINLCGASRP